jgi:hypothetical protein
MLIAGAKGGVREIKHAGCRKQRVNLGIQTKKTLN